MTPKRWPAAIALAALAAAGLAGCSSSTDKQHPVTSTTAAPPATDVTPLPPLPPTPPPTPLAPPAPATDCTSARDSVPVTGSLPAGSLAAATDSTRTALLVTNRGDMTLLIIPGNFNTRIYEARYADPTDAPAQAALTAVTRAPLPTQDPYWPRGVQANQVFIVPPAWSVCALAGDLDQAAAIRASRDKYASAVYFGTLHLAAAAQNWLQGRLTPTALKNAQALYDCGNGVIGLLIQQPRLAGDPAALYGRMVGTTTACYRSYEVLLGDEAKATGAAHDAVTTLGRTPALYEDGKFLLELLRR